MCSSPQHSWSPPLSPFSSRNPARMGSISDTGNHAFLLGAHPVWLQMGPCCPAHLEPSALQSTKQGWHGLVSWPNGCLFKHRSCLHCCGSLPVKHSPLKPYANPIKVSAVQCGEAITIQSQVCLLSSRKENVIEQLKGKSDSAQHHVEDTRLNCSRVCGGQRQINPLASTHC